MTAGKVLMVEPVGFAANPETADDNAFQRPIAGDVAEVRAAAKAEFDGLVSTLRDHGVEVEVFTPPDEETTDAVFPNNWFSTFPDGTLLLYPMRAPSRRRERRPDLVAWLEERYGPVVDLTEAEAGDRFLEGTGSLVVDEAARIVYASTSSRTDPDLAAHWAKRFGHELIMFAAHDRDGREVYHTNVVLSVGEAWAVLCSEAIADTVDRGEVLATLAETGHETIEIDLDQMHDFCGNVLELENAEGKKLIVMSDRAYQAFRPEQLEILRSHAGIVHVDLTTIETHGGGSARCMLAELH